MNHREKRREKRKKAGITLKLKPSKMTRRERHRQREVNRVKLHTKASVVEVSKKEFIDPPAAQVAPLFPTRVEESTGVKVIEAGRNRFRRERIMPNILRVREPFTVVISREATVIDAEPQ